MPSVETRPYLSCAADVVVGDGWIHDRGGLPEALPPQLTEWDPGQDIVLRRTLNVDAPRVRQMCGLGTGATILLSVSWRSAGSGQRGCAWRRALPTEGAAACGIELRLLGAELGGSVDIVTRLLLDSPGVNASPLAPTRKGSVLWEERTTLLLEGIGSRFPMEVVDFVSMSFPPSAAWRLYWQRGNLNAQAMGCFRLLINKRHKKMAAAATRAVPDAEARAIWSAVNTGVAREIITTALHEDAFVDEEATFDPGSVGEAARSLLARAFPGETAQAVRERFQSSPDLFDCQLQAAFHLFEPEAEA